MSKDINVALLYGYYGGLLNDHQQVRAKSIREAGELAKKMIEFGDFN